jgi:acyl-coenzyme A thioesterase PaaI-like protein
MSDTDQTNPRTEDWATLERRDRDSALFVETSDAGLLLCRACRSLQRCRLGIERETLTAEGLVEFETTCPDDHEGGPDVAHGGWIASVLDEMSGHALLMLDAFAVTGSLTVNFLKPIPIRRPLLGRAWVSGREGRRVYVRGELRLADAGDVVATSEAVMIRRPADHFDRHQRWLASREQPKSEPST